MPDILAILAPIALLDGLSIVPVGILPMAVFLASQRPYRTGLTFLWGIVLPYFGFGVLIAVGLGWVMTAAGNWFDRFYTDPTNVELVAQIVIGAAALAFGIRMLRGTGSSRQAAVPEASPGDAFALGAGTSVIGLPGALPYFAAIDQILRADLSSGSSVAALLCYNAILVAPLLLMIVLHAAIGPGSRALFERLGELALNWGPRAFAVLLVALGAVLVIDGTSFLFWNAPLLPTGS